MPKDEKKRREILKAVKEIEEADPERQVSSEPQNISFEKIEQQAKEANKIEEYDLNDNDRIQFYPIFPYQKIKELFDEMADIIVQANELEVALDDGEIINHILFLCVKHFTHLKEDISDKFEEQVQQMEYLVDTGLFSTIVNDVFMPKEIDKVMNYAGDFLSVDKFLQTVSKRASERLEDLEIKNKDMMNVISDKEVEKIRNRYEDVLKD